MKAGILAMAGLIGLLLSPAPAAADSGVVLTLPLCPAGDRSVPVRATVVPVEVVYDFTKDTAGLARLKKSHAAARSWSGLTAWQWHYRIAPVFNRRTDPRSGRSCVWLSDVDMRFGFGRTVVYVARDYAPGTCAHNAVLAHEEQHVAVARRGLARYRDAIVAAVQKAADGLAPVETDSPDALTSALSGRLQDAVKAVVDRMMADLFAENAALDTPESYAQLSAQCRDW